jgi:hypothetical protein
MGRIQGRSRKSRGRRSVADDHGSDVISEKHRHDQARKEGMSPLSGVQYRICGFPYVRLR